MKKLLLHLDTDPVASTFDQAVAYDSGVDNIIAYGGATRDNVTPHVHGMIFTRGGKSLKNSAIFIGGSNVAASDLVGEAVKKAFFGPVRVSVMLDPNGSNTTAAAIVRKVLTDFDVKGKNVVILGSGPVGQRSALYLLKEGAAKVTMTSRSMQRTKAITEEMKANYGVDVTPGETRSDEAVKQLLADAHVAIAAGPAGVCVIPEAALQNNSSLEVIADVNAVPPLGVAGIEVMDNGTEKNGIRHYGAIAIGGFKMKVHQGAVSSLFDSNEQFLDETTIYDIACKIDNAQ
ncbi:NAD(P)-dependent methylenetetrahydromethanopterin dehydrogenase [Methylophaga thiooxydans]|uniref:Methylene-tetrahydromethanopterin dehydrogenase, N-terminal domain family n=1 Tax=Methylophaga thiooxydans DMS010 TaxID=637616 RepID=C0N5L2_9GAMM|nr:NAD(P)-dependent methylenetetrahydromethanopterin dehydrogenase [Methylophaga thiooxydans]EEF79916.1 Methylene-tetrahydromethanopterin dehydrogenase, N-terminal domain family [Methylophaga thiooxydans DMS010]